MNLFIDTNILLAFYHFTSDDLEELTKLAEHVETKKVVLFVPQQVGDEFERNRDAKIADALKGLKAHKFAPQYPHLCKDYAEYSELRELERASAQKHSALVGAVLRDAAARKLKADGIVRRLFGAGQELATTPKVIAAARERMDLGNPPGKNGSLGDAVNWEALLGGVPDGEALYFVTDDRDYWSALDASVFNTVLAQEWLEQKESECIAFRRLSDFFSSGFPEIVLEGEAEGDLLIAELAASQGFLETHALVAQLGRMGEFSDSQANAILSAVVFNTQVGWIAGDLDVRSLIKSVIAGRESRLDQDLLHAATWQIGPDAELGTA